jgi:hypothetical protein
MAITLDGPPESGAICDWDEWADGKWHALVVGEDTPEIPVDVFRKRACSAAKRRGRRASVRIATVTNTAHNDRF